MNINERNSIIKDMADKFGLRTYQKQCAEKVLICFLDSYSKEFLISACCRYGKTTTSLGICKILQAVFGTDDMVICVISGLPGSVKSSWRDDAYRLGLIKNNSLDNLDIANVDFNETTGTKITFISTQKLGNNENKDGEIIEHKFVNEYKTFVNNHKGLKICIKDEAHNAFGTDRTAEALAGFNFDYTLELTATPYTYELINKYRLDSTVGDAMSYFFSQIDMLKLYDSANEIILADGTVAKEGFVYTDKSTGEIKPWRPVKPVIIVEDLYEKLINEGFDFQSLDNELNQTAFVTAYFKTIFGDTKKYKKYCDTFINTYIIGFAAKYNITNILAFDTTNDFANKVAAYINQNFGNQIYAKSLADEKLSSDETSVDKANTVFERNDGKIHFVITCRKCGTGSSMPRLDAAMFLKGVVSYIEYCQFGSRPLNPFNGKINGYIIMFSPTDALQMIAQHANGEKHDTKADPDVKNIKDYLQYIKVFLDGSELVDATEVMSKLDTIYRPGQTILFPSLDLLAKENLDELTDAVIRDAKFKPREAQEPKAPSNDEQDSNTGSKNQDNENKKDKKDVGTYTAESLRKAFQEHFVATIVYLLQAGYTEDGIKEIGIKVKDELVEDFITVTLCSMKLWNKLNKEYFEKVLHKVYVYAGKVQVI